MDIKSSLALLPRDFRRKVPAIVLAGISRRLLDLIGLATLLPVVIVILDPSSIEGDSAVARLFRFAGLDSILQFGVLLAVFALLFLPLKSMAAIWLTNIQNKYLLSIYRHFSQRMYDSYHDRGLAFIRRTYSSQLAVHINGACYGFATGIVGTILNAAAELTVTLCLAAVVIGFAPLASLMLFTALVPVLAVYFAAVKTRLEKLGLDAYEARRNQARIVQESLRGHISLNINNSLGKAKREFGQGLDEISGIDLKMSVYKQIPSVILQICTAAALIVLLLAGRTGGSPVTLFVVFGFAAVRLMPSVLSLANSWNTLRNGRHIIDIIREAGLPDGHHEPDENAEPMSFARQIELKDLTFTFDGGEPLLSGFSLRIRKGESIGFRGSSGAGKSTLFNLLLGFYDSQSGGIYVDGVKLTPRNRKNWHRIVGYVEQEVFIKNDTLAGNIALSASEPDREKVLRVLEQSGLGGWQAGLREGLDTVLCEGGSNLSGGERQRIGIARALYKEPQILFVDESTSALDPVSEENIVSLLHGLRVKDLTLLIISHRETALRHCDRIIEIDKFRIPEPI